MDAPASVLVATLGSAHDPRPTALAQYRSLRDARDAMQSLEAGGMDGDDLALVGETARDIEQEVSRSRDDARILRSATGGVVVGIYRTMGFSESEPLNLEDEPGVSIWLAVYGSSPDVVRPKLDATEPVEVLETPDAVTVHPDEVVAAE